MSAPLHATSVMEFSSYSVPDRLALPHAVVPWSFPFLVGCIDRPYASHLGPRRNTLSVPRGQLVSRISSLPHSDLTYYRSDSGQFYLSRLSWRLSCLPRLFIHTLSSCPSSLSPAVSSYTRHCCPRSRGSPMRTGRRRYHLSGSSTSGSGNARMPLCRRLMSDMGRM